MRASIESPETEGTGGLGAVARKNLSLAAAEGLAQQFIGCGRRLSGNLQGCRHNVLREAVGVDPAAVLGEGEQRRQQVGQLAQIPRPTVLQQPLARRRGQPHAARLAAQAGQHGVQNPRQVGALAQGRKIEDHVPQAVVEVGPEAALGHRGLQVVMRGRHQPEVHAHRAPRTERRHLAVLQDAQQLRLQGQRHVANLVQKQHPAFGPPDVARTALAPRPGKRTLFVAEDLGLLQALGDGRAVDRHKRLRGARGEPLQGAHEDFLARARLPLQKKGNARLKGALRPGQHLNRLGVPDRLVTNQNLRGTALHPAAARRRHGRHRHRG